MPFKIEISRSLKIPFKITWFCGTSEACRTLGHPDSLPVAITNIERDFLVVGVLEEVKITLSSSSPIDQLTSGSSGQLFNLFMNCKQTHSDRQLDLHLYHHPTYLIEDGKDTSGDGMPPARLPDWSWSALR